MSGTGSMPSSEEAAGALMLVAREWNLIP